MRFTHCSISLLAIFISSPCSAQNSDSSAIYETRFQGVTWNNAKWQITTTNLDQGHYQSRMSLANGYHGVNVAALGPFFEVDTPVNGDMVNGWPLFQRRQTFATVGGFWNSQPMANGSNFPWLFQYGGESVISGVPHWGGIVVDLGDGHILDASSSHISNFSSTLDLKQGLMNWQYVWSPPGHANFTVSYQMFVHRLYVNQGLVTMNITASKSENVTIVNVLNGDCAVRTTPGQKGTSDGLIYTSVHPQGVSNVTAFVYSGVSFSGAKVASNNTNFTASYVGNNESSIATAYQITLGSSEVVVSKYVGVASSDAYAQPQVVARTAAEIAMSNGYTKSLASHVQEWAYTFPSTGVDDYSFPQNGSLPNDTNIIESALTAVTNPFYIMQNTISQNASRLANSSTVNTHSIAVSGLGSDSYAGQVYWDAEVWMQPGLVVTNPFAAQGIANYRAAQYGQAQANIKTAYTSSKNKTRFDSNAAIFSWTSGRFGNCTAVGPCFDYEYHINGDIAQEFTNYWAASGDTAYFQKTLYPIYQSIATTYSDLLTKNGTSWVFTNATDPDEYANYVDNGGYTNALIASTLSNANEFRTLFDQSQNSTWSTQAQNIILPDDSEAQIRLEFTGMNGTIDVKQADVVLITYPLAYSARNYSAQDSLNDLNYYANKQSSNGPGMTYAIFSIIANQVSPSGCSAYTYQQYSEQPYARAPWFQLSEQLVDDYGANGGTHPAYPFLTGHGGANQVVPFGYLGYRLIPNSPVLHINPQLPPQIPQIRYRTIHWNGWPIYAFSNQSHTTLSRPATLLPSQGAVPNSTYMTKPIGIQVGPLDGFQQSFSLAYNSSLTIPNNLCSQALTVPGNIAQCLPVTSPNTYVPGQFPIAAVDGASSTKWQPTYANQTASITVSLPVGHRVTGFYFDWAQAPPVNYSIIFHNESSISASSVSNETVTSNAQVKVSNTYNYTALFNIGSPQTNTTNVTLPSNSTVYTAKYATLQIWGSQANGSISVKNMSGDGATVAEFSIIVSDPPTQAQGVGMCQRDLGAKRKRSSPEVDVEMTRLLSRITRGDRSRR